MVSGRADCICKPWCADILRVIKADWSTAGEMPTAPSPFPSPGSWVAGRRLRKKNAFYLAMALPAGRWCPGRSRAVGRSPAGTKGMGGCWLHPTQGRVRAIQGPATASQRQWGSPWWEMGCVLTISCGHVAASTVTTSNLYILKTVSLDKERKDK